MAYSYKNTRDQEYFLHHKKVQLRGNGKEQTIYFFARDIKPEGALDTVPDGYTVKENERTGLPMLGKKK